MPAIDTERLALRGHRRDDFAEYAAMWGNAQVTRHIGGRPFSEEEVWTRLLRSIGHWSAMGFGYWVVRDRESGRFVGECGFAEHRRDIEPRIEGLPEIGWVLAPWAHGKGFATEAVRASIVWGDAHLESRRTACIIDPENHASIRVADKCGFAEAHRTTYRGDPTIIFHRG